MMPHTLSKLPTLYSGSIECMSKHLRDICLLISIAMLPLAHVESAYAARHALLIGNDSYQEVPTLRNARADAEAMGTALQKAGYTVTVMKDRNLKQMKDDVREFKSLIKGGDEVFFFYSGHGVQIEAMNYLLPVDVRAESEDQVRDDALALSTVLSDLRAQKPSLTLAVVDACRDNPFKGTGRAIGGRGLTGVGGANGQMVIYSAGEGQQALDRLSDGDPVKNGLFTRVFMKERERPGVPIDQVARQVRAEVNRQALTVKHEQVPAIYDQVIGQFYFYAQNDASVDQVELVFWTSIKDSSDPAELKAYLEKYPDGQFSGLAQARIKRLEPSQNIPESKPVADTAGQVIKEEAPAKAEEVRAPVVETGEVPDVAPASLEDAKASVVDTAVEPEVEKVPSAPEPVIDKAASVSENAPAAVTPEEANTPVVEAFEEDKQQSLPEPFVENPAALTEITPAANARTHGSVPVKTPQAQVVPVSEEQPTASSATQAESQAQPTSPQ